MGILWDIGRETWLLLLEASTYVLLGLVIAGLLKMVVSPSAVARHLGKGRFKAVLKAAILGIPMPLCSCGVVPAAASLKKQGANNGATTAFLISTPESGVDSIAISYALLDPTMTLARPLAAFATATAAGLTANLLERPSETTEATADLSCPVDQCCDGLNCPPAVHARHHTLFKKALAGLNYAFGQLWGDLAGWFLVGFLLAGIISVLVPTQLASQYLGGGIGSMLIMLGVGIPLYICATASTPIAAALILKGVSPGAALVLLLAGPATNITSLTVLFGFLGKRATAIYLTSIAILSVVFGLLLDQFYLALGISAQATVQTATEIVPDWLQWVGALSLLALSVRPVYRSLARRIGRTPTSCTEDACAHGATSAGMEGAPSPAFGHSCHEKQSDRSEGSEDSSGSVKPPP